MTYGDSRDNWDPDWRSPAEVEMQESLDNAGTKKLGLLGRIIFASIIVAPFVVSHFYDCPRTHYKSCMFKKYYTNAEQYQSQTNISQSTVSSR